MAILRKRDLKEMDAKAMAGKLAELRRELSIERSSAAGVGRTVNPGRIRTIKRTIARILTIAGVKGLKLESVNASEKVKVEATAMTQGVKPVEVKAEAKAVEKK